MSCIPFGMFAINAYPFMLFISRTEHLLFIFFTFSFFLCLPLPPRLYSGCFSSEIRSTCLFFYTVALPWAKWSGIWYFMNSIRIFSHRLHNTISSAYCIPFSLFGIFFYGNAHFEKKNEFEYWTSYFIFIGKCFWNSNTTGPTLRSLTFSFSFVIRYNEEKWKFSCKL